MEANHWDQTNAVGFPSDVTARNRQCMKLTAMLGSGEGGEKCKLDGEMQKQDICKWLEGRTCENPENFTEVP